MLVQDTVTFSQTNQPRQKVGAGGRRKAQEAADKWHEEVLVTAEGDGRGLLRLRAP